MIKIILSNNYTNINNNLISKIEFYEGENNNDKQEAIIFTPEQFLLETNVWFTDRLDNKARFFTEVQTFSRLVSKYLEEKGSKVSIINPTGKSVLLKKAVNDCKNELEYYKKSADKLGFLARLEPTVTGLINSNTAPERLKELYNNNPSNHKLKDIYTIYERYLTIMQDAYTTNSKVLDIVAQDVNNWDYLENKHIYFINFENFVEVEFNYIRNLIENDFDVTIYLNLNRYITKEKLRKGEYYINTFDAYSEAMRTVLKLYNAVTEIEQYKPVDFEIEYDFDEDKNINSTLDLVKNNYLKRKDFDKMEDKLQQNVYVTSYKNKYEEISNIINTIHTKIIEEELQYKDFIIVCDNISDYEIPMDIVFSSLNVPYFIDQKKKIVSHQLCEYIFGIFDLFIYNFNYESVFRFLKNDFCNLEYQDGQGIPKSKIEILENYVFKYNVRGKNWFEPFVIYSNVNIQKQSEETDENIKVKIAKEKLEELNIIREAFVKKIEPIGRLFGDKHKVGDYITEIFNFLDKSNVPYFLGIIKDRSNDPIIQSESAQIWDIVIEIFETCMESIQDIEINYKEMRNILEAGFMANEFGFMPNVNDTIKVVDVFRSRFFGVKNIFFIGATEGVYPSFSEEKTFFDDDDIKTLADNDVNIGNDSFMRLNVQNLNIYNAILKTTDNLYITYPRGTITGKSNKPSILINKIKNITGIDVEENDDYIMSLGEVYKNIYSSNEHKKLIEYINEYINNLKTELVKNIINKEFASTNINNYRKFILVDDNNKINTSISKIEKYNSCPYSYFLQYDLKLRKREEFEVMPSHFGNAYHSVLEMLFNDVKQNQKNDFSLISDDYVKKQVSAYLEEVSTNTDDNILGATAQYRFFTKNIANNLQATINTIKQHLASSDYNFFASEYKVDYNADTKQGNKFYFNGIIDRIDFFKDVDAKTLYIRTVDYKSSSKTIDFNKVLSGRDLQVLKYLDILLKNTKDTSEIEEDYSIDAGGALYVEVKGVKHDASKNISEEDILKEYKFKGVINADTKNKKAFDNLNRSGVGKTSTAIISSTSTNDTKIINKEKFDVLLDYVDYAIKDSVDKIASGNIDIKPVSFDTNGEMLPCQYCDYKSICQIKNNTDNQCILEVKGDKQNTLNDEQYNTMLEILQKEKEGK